MQTEESTRQGFIDQYGHPGGGMPSFDAMLDWWNRGWIDLVRMGPESWIVTPLGLSVLAGAPAPAAKAPAPRRAAVATAGPDLPAARPQSPRRPAARRS